MAQHTKEKGDLAVAKVIADATAAGVKACGPLTEHLPFDIVLIRATWELKRVQVRYASLREKKDHAAASHLPWLGGWVQDGYAGS